MKHKTRRGSINLNGIIIPFALIIIWQIFSDTGVFQRHLLPGPIVVISSLSELLKAGKLTTHIAVTTYRVLMGFLIGASVAIFLGTLSGYYKRAFELFDPIIQALRTIPSLAWVPLFILWLGIGEESKLSLIAVGVFFPVYLNWVMGIRGVNSKYIEVGKMYHFTPLEMVRKILLPAALPSLFTGLRTGLGLGWMFVVAAELMGASSGLGYLMVLGQNSSAPELILGSIILFAILGNLTDKILIYIEGKALHWKDSFKGGGENVSY